MFVAQVTFPAHVSKSDVLEALRVLREKVEVETTQVQEYNPDHGGPVIYFP